jgi:hypothetical protein
MDQTFAAFSEAGTLGLATLVSRSSLGITEQEYATWQAAGFYAIAYDVSNVPGFVPGDRVISYRGTNFGANGPSWPDITAAILEGRQPLDWDAQRKRLGFATAPA